MATRPITRNVALTPHLDQFVQSNVNSGRYQSASAMVREGLRLLEDCEHQLESAARFRQEIEAGWQQSERGEMVNGPSVFAELRKMSETRRKAGKANR